MLASELESHARQSTLHKLLVMEIPTGYYIVVVFPGKIIWYLTTRRNRFEPKVFRDLNRLNEFLKKICINNFELQRVQKLPPLAEERG